MNCSMGMNGWRAGLGVVVTCVLWTGQATFATDIILDPVIDGTQQMTGFPFPSFTYNTSAAAMQASFSQVQSHANVSRTENKFAMEFDLSTIPAGNVVTSATLSWTELTDFLSPGNTHPLAGYTGDGLLTGTDFFGGVSLGQVANAVNDGRVSVDVTTFLADRVDAGDAFVGFSVVNGGYYTTSTGMFSSYTTVGTYQIASRLHGDPNARPQLVVTVVPEMGAVSLLGCGALLIFAIASRRRDLP